MALFSDQSITQVLAQGAQALSQTLQVQTQLLQRRQQMDNEFDLRQKALAAREQAAGAKADQSAAELETERLKLVKLRAETELKIGDVRTLSRDRIQRELAGNDPVETNRRFEGLADLTRERNRLESQLTRLQEALIVPPERIEQTKAQMGNIDRSINFRLDEMLKQGIGKDEASIPIKVAGVPGAAKGREAFAQTVQVSKAQAGVADAPSSADFLDSATLFLSSRTKDAKGQAISRMAEVMRGTDNAAQIQLTNELMQSLIQSGKSRTEARRIIVEEISPALRRQMGR